MRQWKGALRKERSVRRPCPGLAKLFDESLSLKPVHRRLLPFEPVAVVSRQTP